MGYYTDISNSEYAAKDTALQNRLNGVDQQIGRYGHTALGAILTQNTTGIFGLLTSFFDGNGSENGDVTGAEIEEENANFQEQSNKRTTFNNALTAFNKTPNQETAKALTEAYEANKSSLAKQAYDLCKKNHPDLFTA